MPLLKRVRVLGAKVEAVPGVAETIANVDCQYNVFDAEMQPDIEFFERPLQGSFNHLRGALGARGATCTFRTEVYGGANATASPAWVTFLQGCGMTNSSNEWTFTSGSVGTTSGSQRTLTIDLFENGKRKRMRGAMGTFTVNLPTGRPAFIEWTFNGIWVAPNDTAIPSAISYPAQMPMRAAAANANTGISIVTAPGNVAWNPCFESMTIDAGNEVILRPCVNPTDASGFTTALITNRRTTGEFNPESSVVATKNYYSDWLTYGLHDMVYTLTDGTASVRFALPGLQFENVQESDRENIQTDTISFTQTQDSLRILVGDAV